MATVAPTITQIDDRHLLIKWSGLVTGDVGDWVEVAHYNYLGIQGIASWRGTHEIGLTTFDVKGSFNNALQFTARYIRPEASVAGPVDVILFAVKRG